jgi:Protein of unknown function (DUF3027)
MTPVSSRRPTADTFCAEAVDLAREALDDLTTPETVGEHLGVEGDEDRVVTHLFEAKLVGYPGWRWAVTVARASRGRTVTVDEAALLPGPDALLPPEWVPWTERLRPGDLGVGDLLPTDEDDERLEPGWNASSDVDAWDGADADSDDLEADLAELAGALDLIRPRVLSPIGLDDAVDRWWSGELGPESPMAHSAPATCASCGFRLPLRGRLSQMFGVCANEIAPSDGRVVALTFGCGAHSEAVVVPSMASAAEPLLDETGYDVLVVTDQADAGSVHASDPGEELGHG